MADIPYSLFPEVIATIGADGKVSLEERQAQKRTKDVIAPRPQAGQQQHQQQSRQTEAKERLGPAGDNYVSLAAPPAADVTATIVNNDGAAEGFNDSTASIID